MCMKKIYFVEKRGVISEEESLQILSQKKSLLKPLTISQKYHIVQIPKVVNIKIYTHKTGRRIYIT